MFAANGTGDNAGIRLMGVSGVTVRNGTVTGFDAGVVIGGGSSKTVRKIVASDTITLVAGGATFPPAFRPRSAELYNPAIGEWTAAAEMNDEHGSSSSLANSDRAVVLSSNPWRFEARPEACAPHCGKVLVPGNSPTGTVELYTPTCPSVLPRPPQQLSCVRDGPGAGRPGAPGTPGEPGPPEWLGTPGGADRPEAEAA